MTAPSPDREQWIKAALRLVPEEYHQFIVPQFHVLMDKIDEAKIPELNYDLAALVLQNKMLKDGLNRQFLMIEALQGGSDKLRMEAWHSMEDMKKAEAILYDALRSVLLPKDSTKMP